MTEEFRKFPERWPYINPHGVVIEKREVDEFVAALYSSPSHYEKFKNRGVELCSVILWAMERVTIQSGVAALAYAGCKTMFKMVPRFERDWKSALVVKRRKNLRALAARSGEEAPTIEELKEQEKDMFDELRRLSISTLSSEDYLREDLNLLRISYELKALPGESLAELAKKPSNRQAEKVAKIRKRFKERGWLE